jgi:glycerol-3-phosphate dehydrogenase
MLGQGKKLNAALTEVGMVVEGVSMAKTIVELARFNIKIPLFKCISRIVFDECDNVREELIGTIERY